MSKTDTVMRAYEDNKCRWGYIIICDECRSNGNVPHHVNLQNCIVDPPAKGKVQPCEQCGKSFKLIGLATEAA